MVSIFAQSLEPAYSPGQTFGNCSIQFCAGSACGTGANISFLSWSQYSYQFNTGGQSSLRVEVLVACPDRFHGAVVLDDFDITAAAQFTSSGSIMASTCSATTQTVTLPASTETLTQTQTQTQTETATATKGPSPLVNQIDNAYFETGSLSLWTATNTTYAAFTVSSANPHRGLYNLQVSSTLTNGYDRPSPSPNLFQQNQESAIYLQYGTTLRLSMAMSIAIRIV